MKSPFFKILLRAIIAITMQSCGGDDPEPEPAKSAEEIATEKLTGTGVLTWQIAGGGTVTRDGISVTDLYKSFELSLISELSKTYSCKNCNDLFDPSGPWSFAGTNFDKFILNGTKPAAGREISFTQTGDNLTLTFSIPAPGARINGVMAVAGNYTFNLLKK